MAAPANPLSAVLERMAAELASASNLSLDDARRLVEQLTDRWRGEAARAGERAGAALDGLFGELGLVTRDDFVELELRVAQLEHRLRLVEGGAGPGDGRRGPGTA
jgi:polyhydroxyalkanoate synthesis regulator phasin